MNLTTPMNLTGIAENRTTTDRQTTGNAIPSTRNTQHRSALGPQ